MASERQNLEGVAGMWKGSEGMNGECVVMTTTTTALVGVVWEVRPQRQRQSEGMTCLVERGTPRGLISRALAARVAVVRTLLVVGAQAQAPGGDVLQLHQPQALQAAAWVISRQLWGGRLRQVPLHYKIGGVVPTSNKLVQEIR